MKKKNIPRYSPKEQVYKILARSNHFWLSRLPCMFSCQFGPRGPKTKIFKNFLASVGWQTDNNFDACYKKTKKNNFGLLPWRVSIKIELVYGPDPITLFAAIWTSNLVKSGRSSIRYSVARLLNLRVVKLFVPP